MDENPEENQDQPVPPSDSSELPQPEIEAQTPESEPKPQTREEAFAEVRQSLREEEKSRKPGFFERLKGRLGKRARSKQEASAAQVQEDLGTPSVPQWEPLAPPAQEPPTEPEPLSETPVQAEAAEPSAPPEEEIDTALDRAMRAIKQMQAEPAAREEPPAPVAEEGPAGTRRSILTSIRGEEGEEQQVEEVGSIRQEALEDYSAQPEEPVVETRGSVQQTLRRSWRAMRPLEKRMLVTSLIVIVAAVIVGSGVLVVNSLRPSAPAITPTPSDLPYPVSVTLPGGLAFQLRKGAVQDGKWNPIGPEWLEGTEVCRWVSIPWSVQLEAVLRTLKPDDEIGLAMSNADSLVYKVKSIQQIPEDQIAKLASDGPCLLVFLSKQDSNTRWLVTALP